LSHQRAELGSREDASAGRDQGLRLTGTEKRTMCRERRKKNVKHHATIGLNPQMKFLYKNLQILRKTLLLYNRGGRNAVSMIPTTFKFIHVFLYFIIIITIMA